MSAYASSLRLMALLACLISGAAEAADRPPPSPQAEGLATCHGYYTAVVEHSRLVAQENDGAVLRRDMIAAMMNSYLFEHEEDRNYTVAMMQVRVQARSQMRNLFRSAVFDRDPRRNRLALGQIRRDLGACDAMMLDRRFASY